MMTLSTMSANTRDFWATTAPGREEEQRYNIDRAALSPCLASVRLISKNASPAGHSVTRFRHARYSSNDRRRDGRRIGGQFWMFARLSDRGDVGLRLERRSSTEAHRVHYRRSVPRRHARTL